MPIEITMPRLSDTMETGTIIKWNVKEGDHVEPGDVIADIETDKATMELQAYDEGTVARILLPEGKEAPVGAAIMVLAEEGEDAQEVADSAGAASCAGAATTTGAAAGAQAAGSASAQSATAVAAPGAANGAAAPPAQDAPAEGGRIFASPLARKLAQERGVDLAALQGTGPGGRIVKRDVEQAAAAGSVTAPTPAGSAAPTTAPPAPAMRPAAPAALEAKVVPLSNMRRTIARRLVEAKRTIPHYQVTVAVEMDELLRLRKGLNEQLAAQGVKLSVNDFLVRACALAMHEHPFVNSRWVEQGPDGQAAIETLAEVNIGVAIALPLERGGGLVVGVLRQADQQGLRTISAETKRLAEKARTKGLSVEEMEGATFTISNLGMFGVEHFNAIINPPNAAILAVGAAIEQPVVRNGQIVVGHRMQMTMSSDHRVIDGAMAAAYLGTVKQLLESPATLLV